MQLSHPHIVKIVDVGEHEGIPFAVMQYLGGGSLEERRPVAADGSVLPVEAAFLAGCKKLRHISIERPGQGRTFPARMANASSSSGPG